ncbi:hypothetical protein C8J57DRAFT_1190374 [Mycena rebaudengoi]|nr:hypothetical protein C8J57DRAFT_1190374 [Mycena rebaudengoi]
MANCLPDEIISEILSPALRVSDEAFSCTTEGSPFVSYLESSSAFLLVSKAWLRVSTPLLYHVVIIRSRAQAQALDLTLRSNPELGRFIKKLRMEGGFQISMFKILQASAKSITDLFISLNTFSTDNACGLCRGLLLLDPIRLILHNNDPRRRPNSKSAELCTALVECMPKWTNLVSCVFPVETRVTIPISEVLSRAQNLKTVTISDLVYYRSTIPVQLLTVLKNPALQRIRHKPPIQKFGQAEFFAAVQKNTRLSALFSPEEQFATADSSIIAPSLPAPSLTVTTPSQPFIYPAKLANNSDEEDAIWSRVLHFAICQPNDDSASSHEKSTLALLLVSKTFARIAIPHLYEHPNLFTPFAWILFHKRLMARPSLGHYIRSLTLGMTDSRMPSMAAKHMFAHMPALMELDSASDGVRWTLTCKEFEDFAKSNGSILVTLNGLSVAKGNGTRNPSTFALFRRIRHFTWDSKTVFNTKVSPGTFSTVEEINLGYFDPTFLVLLSHMQLPSIQRIAFSPKSTGGNNFFEAHGSKLKALTVSVPQMNYSNLFQTCPSLTTLTISCDEKSIPPERSAFKVPKHLCLERIIIRTSPGHYNRYRLSQTQEKQWADLLSVVDLEPFPVLREIQHLSCAWPTASQASNSRSLNNWVRCAESLLDQNIKLADRSGTHWKRRLKFVKSSGMEK